MGPRKSQLLAYTGVLAATLVLVPLSACSKSSSSGSALSNSQLSRCIATGSDARGDSLTVPITITTVPGKTLATPTLAVSLGQAKIEGGDTNAKVEHITVTPVLQAGRSFTSRVKGGRATLTPTLGQGGWVAVGTVIPVTVRVVASAASEPGIPEVRGECKSDVKKPRSFRKTLDCLRNRLKEKLLEIVVEITEKDGGWTITIIKASGGYLVTSGEKQGYSFANPAELYIVEQSGNRPPGKPVRVSARTVTNSRPPGTKIWFTARSRAPSGKRGSTLMECSTYPFRLGEGVDVA